MQKKLVIVALLLIQSCGPLLAQTPAPASEEESVSPGILQRVVERTRAAKDQVVAAGDAVLGYVNIYYVERIEPVTDPYMKWAYNTSSSLWDRVRVLRDQLPNIPLNILSQ